VKGDIVDDHDVAWRQGRCELGFYPCFEDAAVHWRVDDSGCGQAMTAQSGDKSLRFRGTERCMGAIALAPWRPSSSFRQLGIGRVRRAIDSLDRLLIRLTINKDQPCQSLVEERLAMVDPQITGPRDFGP